MPRTQEAIARTDGYQAALAELRGRTRRDIAAAWALIDLDDTNRSYRAFVELAASVIYSAQQVAGAMIERYLAAFLVAELEEQLAPEVDPDLHVGEDPFGRTLQRALKPPLLTVRMQLRQHGRGPALNAGRQRATRIADESVAESARNTLGDAIERDPRIHGWRRVGGTCAACLADTTTRAREPGDSLHRHPFCDCVAEPTVAVFDAIPRPSGTQIFAAMSKREQDRRFGTDKAKLLRRGRLELKDLVDVQEQKLGGVIITERPLSQLAREV